MRKKYQVEQENVAPPGQYTGHLLENVTFPLHINLEMEIMVVLRGDITMQIGRGSQVIQAGEGVFVLPFETHDCNTPVESHVAVYTFPPSAVAELAAFFDRNRPTYRIFPVPEALRTWLSDSMAGRDAQLAFADMLGAVGPLFALIVRHCRFVLREGGTDNLFLNAVSCIDRTYMQDISLAKVAAALGVTDKKLSRVFFQESGIYFSDYLNMRRVSQAGTLLAARAGSIAQVAAAVGYDNTRTFSRCFRHCFGVTPAGYVRQIKGKGAPASPAGEAAAPEDGKGD